MLPLPRSTLLLLLAASGCYADSAVEGLPCTDDRSCGPEHVCTLGYCRDQPEDALAGCGDGTLAVGEWCYPLSRRLELPLGDTAELRDLAWADLDGNGLDDALVITAVATAAYLNLGGAFNANLLEVRLTPESLASLPLPEAAAELTVPVQPRRLTTGDFVGDALPDMVFALEVTAEVSPMFDPLREIIEAPLWIANNQGDSLSAPLPIPATDPLGLAELPEGGLQTGDFDGDGRVDLVVVTTDDQGTTIRWLRGSPQGPTSPQVVPLDGAARVMVADIDEDGRDDLIGLRRTMGMISWLRGPLDATTPERLDLGAPVTAIHVGPLDDAPGQDLAVLGQDPATRTLWSWTGESFAEATSREGPEALDIAGGDVDGDLVPDLLTVGPEGVMVQSGFTGPQLGAALVIVDEAATTIEARSLDDDAAPDLVLTDTRCVIVRLANP
ncbi:MAG: VCBS repeat-containing protein [Myxococcota bacterium]